MIRSWPFTTDSLRNTCLELRRDWVSKYSVTTGKHEQPLDVNNHEFKTHVVNIVVFVSSYSIAQINFY